MHTKCDFEFLIDAQNQLGECVLWCERTQCVYWTDIEKQWLYSYCPVSRFRSEWRMPERLCCFAFTSTENVLLVGLASRLAFFDLNTSIVTDICEVEPDLPTTRLNDGRCDRQGRFVFGTLDESDNKKAIGSFYRLNHDLTLERLPLPGIAIANSICFGLNGDTMFFCDSLQRMIYRWDNYTSNAAPQIWPYAETQSESIFPDGATIDAEDYLWSAQWGGGRIVRYTPDGHIDRILSLPVTQSSCVCVGGIDRRTLFVTSARIGLSPSQLSQELHAGGVFSVKTNDILGVQEVCFAHP